MCPNCGSPLVIVELESVETDYCVACGGTWLDSGEIERIAEAAGLDAGEMERALHDAPATGPTRRRCVRCGKRMETFRVGGVAAVEFDRCRRGHGLWLDRGELESVVRAFASGRESAVASFFSDVFRSEIGGGTDA